MSDDPRVFPLPLSAGVTVSILAAMNRVIRLDRRWTVAPENPASHHEHPIRHLVADSGQDRSAELSISSRRLLLATSEAADAWCRHPKSADQTNVADGLKALAQPVAGSAQGRLAGLSATSPRWSEAVDADHSWCRHLRPTDPATVIRGAKALARSVVDSASGRQSAISLRATEAVDA